MSTHTDGKQNAYILPICCCEKMLLWCRTSQSKVTGSEILTAFVLVLVVRSLVLQKVLGPSQELACFLVILYLPTIVPGSTMHFQ